MAKQNGSNRRSVLLAPVATLFATVTLLALILAPVEQVDAADALYLCMKNCEQVHLIRVKI